MAKPIVSPVAQLWKKYQGSDSGIISAYNDKYSEKKIKQGYVIYKTL